ncbi:MAG: hypothetical protein WD226_13170 [Planctomycetota bacterium]
MPASPLEALAATLAVEVAVFLVLGGLLQRESLLPLVWCAVGVNLVSHPLAVAVFLKEGVPWLAVEGAVVLVEVLLLRWTLGWGWGWALPLVVAANLGSIVMGPWLT